MCDHSHTVTHLHTQSHEHAPMLQVHTDQDQSANALHRAPSFINQRQPHQAVVSFAQLYPAFYCAHADGQSFG